ncbi:NUDIX hydrolase [[Pantoea] beijingensis]|uniref:NUDIX hydrolase n=1 Tax=[Pantoea] beijingensis TaxID=1324864 RepID=A0A443IIG7_9GAMM|nr:CoA pyrophosphatase [[Pantoea] beijingensis]RWR03800.1 NUDIX hydrolase [[Pantoea] beijingensis]
MNKTPMTLDDFLTRFTLQPPQPITQSLPTRRAAVLVPIVARQAPGLLLTRRADSLRTHAGQVAFPGGVMDPTDHSLIFTALRETQEELAIPPSCVRVVGTLPNVTSSTGFQVTPIVGIIPDNLRYHANKDEVAAVFEMPLQEALRPGRYSPLDIHREGIQHRVWLSWFEEYFIWGMTAGIIRQLSQQISGGTAMRN